MQRRHRYHHAAIAPGFSAARVMQASSASPSRNNGEHRLQALLLRVSQAGMQSCPDRGIIISYRKHP